MVKFTFRVGPRNVAAFQAEMRRLFEFKLHCAPGGIRSLTRMTFAGRLQLVGVGFMMVTTCAYL
jgi:hypothetical protein